MRRSPSIASAQPDDVDIYLVNFDPGKVRGRVKTYPRASLAV